MMLKYDGEKNKFLFDLMLILYTLIISNNQNNYYNRIIINFACPIGGSYDMI